MPVLASELPDTSRLEWDCPDIVRRGRKVFCGYHSFMADLDLVKSVLLAANTQYGSVGVRGGRERDRWGVWARGWCR